MPRAPSQLFDRISPLLPDSGASLPDPFVYDLSPGALRRKVVAWAAKRYVDMLYVTGLDQPTADRHFRIRAAGLSGDLGSEPDGKVLQAEVDAAWKAGHITVTADDSERRVTVRWDDPAFGAPAIGRAIARPGYGGIVLGPHAAPAFDPAPIARPARPAGAWPLGDGGAVPGRNRGPAELEQAIERLFQTSAGVYGVLVARPDGVVAERYGVAGGPDRPTPSWSMTKAITATVLARMLHEGWIASVYDPAPAPMWRDPRAIQRLVTLDDLMRMRSGLAFPAVDGEGRSRVVFENSFVYYDGEDAFATAQRAIVATRPGSVFRYINTGVNVIGAIIRDRIEARGLPYHQTVYGLLADRIGMTSYQHSADRFGNFVASGSGAAVLRDYARLGVLYLQDGVWNGERLLPEGWVDYALTPTHVGSHYAACFRTNLDRMFPSLPTDAAWASGASDQKVIILRGHRLVIAVANETDHPLDLAALDGVGAAAIATVPGAAQRIAAE
ncbi:MAG: serine hydrolase [Alphaproteobacteria bacterium]|nr:serine hydrolase [Alphaproteobacteria bacterium]